MSEEFKEVQVVLKVLKESGLLHWNEQQHAILALARDIVWEIHHQTLGIAESEMQRVRAELEAQGLKVVVNAPPVNNPTK